MGNNGNTRALRERRAATACRSLRRLALAVGSGLLGSADAATITVNDPSGNSVPGACGIVDAIDSINQGSLVAGSNCSNSGGAFGNNDTIRIPAGNTITFSAPTPTAMSALVLTKPMTLLGAIDAAGTPTVTLQRSTVSGTPQFRLIETTADLTLQGLRMQNGDTTSPGGAVYAKNVTLTLTNSIVSGNVGGTRGGSTPEAVR
jgi:hypothetical protein